MGNSKITIKKHMTIMSAILVINYPIALYAIVLVFNSWPDLPPDGDSIFIPIAGYAIYSLMASLGLFLVHHRLYKIALRNGIRELSNSFPSTLKFKTIMIEAVFVLIYCLVAWTYIPVAIEFKIFNPSIYIAPLMYIAYFYFMSNLLLAVIASKAIDSYL